MLTTKLSLVYLATFLSVLSTNTEAQISDKHISSKRNQKISSDLNKNPINSTSNTQVTPPFQPVFFEPSEPVTRYLVNEPSKVFNWIENKIKEVPGRPDQYSSLEERQKYESAVIENFSELKSIPIIGKCINSYNARKQGFEIIAKLAPVNDVYLSKPNPRNLNLRSFTLTKNNLQRDTYKAQNAYGAAIEVSREISDDYVISFPAGKTNEPSTALVPDTKGTYSESYNSLILNFNLEGTLARNIEKKIACMFIISLDAPYYFKYKEKSAPTRDYPYDITKNANAIFGRLDQFVIINIETGELYDQAARQMN